MTDSYRVRVEQALGRITREAEDQGEALSPDQIQSYRVVLESLFSPQLEPTPAGWEAEALSRILPANPTLADRIREQLAKAQEWTSDAFVTAARSIEGTMILGSGSGSALAGTRGAGELGPTSILYEFEPGRLILELTKENTTRRLDGQFVAHVDRAEETRLAKVIQQTHVDTVAVSETGRFTFAGLHEGFARVEVLWGDIRMGIDPIEM